MLIRKNTKAFKTILEIVTACQSRADREQLIRLFITKAGTTVRDRISVDSIQGDASLFYEMNYQTVLNSLRSSNHQLNESDEIPGLYFFHSTSNKTWDETPFEFDEAIKKIFSSLPDLPIVRRKEKTEKFVFPGPVKKNKVEVPKKKSEKKTVPKAQMVVLRGPKQPDFDLKHKIEFTNLDKIIFRQPEITKTQILTYYHEIADTILPYLKDRRLWIRTSAETSRPLKLLNNEFVFGDEVDDAPEWVRSRAIKRNGDDTFLLANDKEHLLYYVERGALEFHPSQSKTKQLENPDYILVIIDSPESDIQKAIDVARHSKIVMDGLKLPSFIKFDGLSGLHLYIPLDGKTGFQQSRDAARYVCQLISLKVPDLVSLVGSDDNTYGKVTMDYSLNEEGQSVVAPYSLVAGEALRVAAPLRWDEINSEFNPDVFSHDNIFKRLEKVGDPFENLYKKKVNAAEAMQNLEDRYSFLFDHP